ncbi:DotU family type VI secretion system protein [Derxia gummosa]|uniref:DotU family type VI secretion system protein n=1 Tax=Derxia gummosa DSM 723 TaxID=1121388 RepID=A0A8B6X239_9BURK|nr:DotU family type VI secretion system protein [Derxia gummosa]
MTDQDPFAAFGDRTVIKPGGGRARPGPSSAPAGAPATAFVPVDAEALDGIMTGSFNPLVDAATPLLNAAPRIRQLPQHPSPPGLRDALAAGVKRFEATARARGLPNEQVIAARYILCTFLDESAASTPWGGSGVWSAYSLLVQFHNETQGGEKVFQLLARLAPDVNGNRSLLELLYACMALGFEGRYRVIDNGHAQLDSVRSRLAQMLRQPDEEDPALSPRWQGAPARSQRLVDGVPVWVVAAVAALLLLAVFVALRLGINSHSAPAFIALQTLDAKAPTSAAVASPPVALKPRLATFLKAEIDEELVAVQDLADRSIVTIKGDGLFSAGSTELADRARPVLARVAAALEEVPGQVLVTGHTDSQPIRSLRFPSNWHLSQERALAVKAVLAPPVAADRLRAEGHADAEPLADNATPEGRARNRRVEITLFVSPDAR